jgi:hypothetical protein
LLIALPRGSIPLAWYLDELHILIKFLRPDASRALSHPYFWTASMQLAFLQDVSDRLEGEDRDTSPILKALERKAAKVLGGTDWYSRLDPGLIETLGKYRRYDGASVQDLMRVIRNKVGVSIFLQFDDT